MLDQIYGKPSGAWKRTQVFLVLLFWVSRISRGNPTGPPLPLLRRFNNFLSRFTPYQLILSTLTLLYALKNGDAILGLQAPEPLARLYSKNYYRATWIVTALDAGFATAMNLKPKPLRDVVSMLFAIYYLIFANEADEKLRKYRAVCTVEMLRVTWEKTTNPIIRFVTQGDRPKIGIRKRILLPRPKGSTYTKPIVAWLYFNGTEPELSQQTDLIFDLPGGGFICMSPLHHEERILRWAIKSGRPVISFDYGKAPEYPFPFAIDECYDAYKLLYESKGLSLGMKGTRLDVILTGDSAGANIATAMLIKILETKPRLPLPVALVFAYAALSFHFTSWMPSGDLKVLRQESSSNIAGLLRGKDHLDHKSPLSVVDDTSPYESTSPTKMGMSRSSSIISFSKAKKRSGKSTGSWTQSFSKATRFSRGGGGDHDHADGDDEEDTVELSIPPKSPGREPGTTKREKDKSVSERIVWWDPNNKLIQAELQSQADQVSSKVLENVSKGPLETRLAMTSRTAFFNDRIISPPMCRAMALLYIGPRNAPDLHTDYHISPIFTPPNLLHQFPPVYLSCGERDPFVDDTVIFAGKLREAKETRKLELMARDNKFGESLRMSASSSSTREAILDETEEDWVQTRIIEGWSHGYLQMMSLLPEAVHAIDMMSDWIVGAFDKNKLKRNTSHTPSAHTTSKVSSTTSAAAAAASSYFPSPTRKHGSGLHSTSSPSRAGGVEGSKTVSKPSITSESEKEDDILSFTPRKRSPRGSAVGGGTPTGESPVAPRIALGKRNASSSSNQQQQQHHRSLSALQNSSSSSDETTNNEKSQSSLPTTPELNHVSPILKAKPQRLPSAGEGRGEVPPPPALHIVSPHERALSDQVFLDDDGNPFDTQSDNETLLSRPHAKKETRSGSAGSATAPKSSIFVDAKDLLRRRREEAVYGISQTNSAIHSEDEDMDHVNSNHHNHKGKSGKSALSSE